MFLILDPSEPRYILKKLLPKKLIDLHCHPWDDDPAHQEIVDFLDEHLLERILMLGLHATVAENQKVINWVQAEPARIIGGPCIDLRAENILETIQYYCEQGCRFVKLFPNWGFYPDDVKYRSVFELIAQLGMGVLSHCGWLGVGLAGHDDCNSATRFARPGRFEILFRTLRRHVPKFCFHVRIPGMFSLAFLVFPM